MRTHQGYPGQAGGELVPHCPVPAVLEQGQCEDEVHHHPGRQQADPPLHRSGFREYRVHQREVHHLRELAQMPRREHLGRYLD
nr:hypothetical protein [Streptomyces sp. A1-5]